MDQEVDAGPAGVTARRDGPAPAGRRLVAPPASSCTHC
jgi:hypothetical protein